MLTQDQLKSVITYDSSTGLFFRQKNSVQCLAGTLSKSGYVQIGIFGKRYYAHRLAWLYEFGEMPDFDIDHKNGNKQDNRIENLRIATRSQNIMNVGIKSNNTSGIKGVSWIKKRGKWQALVCINGLNHHLGLYEDIRKAERAVVTFRESMIGEFCKHK